MSETSFPQKLIVFVNPVANRGSGLQSWGKIEGPLKEKGVALTVVKTESRDHLLKMVHESMGRGDLVLGAAGGDGTIQAVLDGIMTFPQPETIAKVQLATFGTGTSNDFHKPFAPERSIDGVPCRIGLGAAKPFDVIRLEVTDVEGKMEIRHWIQSSHLGTIPTTNYTLTQERSFSHWLYHIWYAPALLFASAVTVFTYPGFSGEIKAGGHTWKGLFSGMSLLKRSNVAGNFVFKTSRQPDDGCFDFALCEKISSFQLIGLIDRFEKQGMEGHPEVHYCRTDAVEAAFDHPQPIDFDGELLVATSARWQLLPKAFSIF